MKRATKICFMKLNHSYETIFRKLEPLRKTDYALHEAIMSCVDFAEFSGKMFDQTSMEWEPAWSSPDEQNAEEHNQKLESMIKGGIEGAKHGPCRIRVYYDDGSIEEIEPE